MLSVMFQYKQIQAFYTVMVIGTVTEAAKSLGISQPGVSNLIKSLEHQIGFKLFKRIKGRLYPTPEAKRLFDSTQGIIEGFDQVQRRASAIRHLSSGKLIIGGLPEISLEYLPALIGKFLLNKSQINISFQTRSSVKVQEMVADHLIEVGITEGPVAHDNLFSKKFSFPCYCLIPENHKLSKKASISPTDLNQEPLIMLGRSHMTNHRLRELFTNSKSVWNDRCQTSLFSTAISLAREGFGITLADPFTIHSQNLDKLVVKPFKPIVPFDIVLIWAKDRPLSLIGNSFINYLKNELELTEGKYKSTSIKGIFS